MSNSWIENFLCRRENEARALSSFLFPIYDMKFHEYEMKSALRTRKYECPARVLGDPT